MKAIKVHEMGGPEVLKLEDIPIPFPGKGEVLVEVHAASLNPIDSKLLRADPAYQNAADHPLTPGFDLAGSVVEIGENVKHIHVGDRVYGQAAFIRKGSGAFAEYAVTPEDSIARMPDNISFTEAAATPLAACSAYQALVEHMKLTKNQRILVQGGSGGIGTFAIQLAKHLGAYVASTATGKGIQYVKDQGADRVIDYESTAFEELLHDYDAVLDTVGGEIYRKSFEVLRHGGILVSMLSRPDEALMKKFGVRAVLETTKVDSKKLGKITDLIKTGVLKINIAEVYPLQQTKEAFEAKEKEKILGKIAIEVKKSFA
ncbi:NADP-dependent oxidoreductase [Chryseolinea sp. H1M3-3]|uniref:NADP-dependent oxidoreductase n=1 Tax=Chryseolinea sp. H1M3-3 TaxID=3034144 RepID=UPI0023EAEA94|nr:NADP-dependent oxidoreductase [Chryseolinea sp. H1M3-3]